MVCPEAVAIQHRLMEEAARRVEDTAHLTGWTPKVVPPTYPTNMSKGDRVSMALEWRFNRGRIKLPASDTPADSGYDSMSINSFNMLYTQIDDFTSDLKLLPYDDGIDTLAMSGYIPRQSGVPRHLEPFARTPIEHLANGELYLPGTNLPLMSIVDINKITPEIEAVLRRKREGPHRIRSRATSSRFDNSRQFMKGL